jgi:hypothetical protein
VVRRGNVLRASPEIPVTGDAALGVTNDVAAELRHEREDFRVGGGNLTKALGRVRFAPESCRGRRRPARPLRALAV